MHTNKRINMTELLLKNKKEEQLLEEHKLAKKKKLEEEAKLESANRLNVESKSVREARILNRFSEKLKMSLLTECIWGIYKPTLEHMVLTDKQTTLARNLVSNYVQESGPNAILERLNKSNSILLSEMNRIVRTNYDIILKEAKESCKDCDSEDDLTIDGEAKDNFFIDLDQAKPDDLIDTIRGRVSDAVQNFINANVEDKIDIKDLMTDIRDRVNGSPDEELKESFSIEAKRKTLDIQNRPKGLMHHMVHSLAKTAFTNESVGIHYLNENGKLDLDSITENCQIMIAFLETLNTTEIEVVDKSYIKKIIDSYK